MRERPTTRQLEYFVALAEELNFRRAAEICYVTQPTLSTQIKQLETTLGVTLFERDKRHVMLTQVGQRLLKEAFKVLHNLDNLLDIAAGHDHPLAGSLRLGVIPTIAPYLIPGAIPQLRKAYPKLRLYIREYPTETLVDLLSRGELDVLLVAKEARIGDVATLDLCKDPFLLAVAEDHPLATAPSVLENDLIDEPLILLEDGH